MKEIAVIIPAYKTHKTIKRTLCSLSSQFGVSFNVYVIVDGEPEGSYDYLKNMFSDIIDLKIIYKKENSGPGASRQYAIENTQEPFITFIDADDILANTNALYIMRKAFEPEDAVIITPFYQELPDGSGFRIRAASFLTWMHGKMYRREFIDKYKIHFFTEGANSYSNEDMGFNSMISLISDAKTERIKLLDSVEYVTYIQLRSPTSITMKNNNEFSRSLINITGFVNHKLHGFDYVVNTLGIYDKGISEAAARSMAHLYLNYVGIYEDVEGYKEGVDKLALQAYNELTKYMTNLNDEQINEIEKDVILSSGYSYIAYKSWKDKITNGG